MRNNVVIVFGTLALFFTLISHSQWHCVRLSSFFGWWWELKTVMSVYLVSLVWGLLYYSSVPSLLWPPRPPCTWLMLLALLYKNSLAALFSLSSCKFESLLSLMIRFFVITCVFLVPLYLVVNDDIFVLSYTCFYALGHSLLVWWK